MSRLGEAEYHHDLLRPSPPAPSWSSRDGPSATRLAPPLVPNSSPSVAYRVYSERLSITSSCSSAAEPSVASTPREVSADERNKSRR